MNGDFYELIKYLDKKLTDRDKKFRDISQKFLDLDNKLNDIQSDKVDKLGVAKLLDIIEIYTKRADIYFQILVALNRGL